MSDEDSKKSGSQAASEGRSRDGKERIFLIVVDESEEMEIALRFACRRARHTGGRVAMLHVVEHSEFRGWMSVGDLMQEEARNEAERLLQKLAARVNELAGAMPVLYLREGNRRDELLKLIEEEPSISILVLGANTGKGGPGPLVSQLTGKLMGQLNLPITIVPGNLSDEAIDAIS